MGVDIETWYRRYGPMVLRRCRKLLGGDEDRAMDAMQEVFVRVIRAGGLMRDEHPSSLLYRIATNVCLNAIRDEARAKTDADSDLLSRIAVHGDDRRVEIEEAIDRLFRRHAVSTRVIAVMHYVDGMTLEEVARETGLSVSGVRKRLRKLREDARAHLGTEGWS